MSIIEDIAWTRARKNGEFEAGLCFKSFAEFVKRAWPEIDPEPLVWGRHMQAICDHLQAVTEGLIQNLIINVPPGHAKPVDVNSWIMASTGRVRLRDILVGDKVLTHLGRYREVTVVHEQGVLPLLEILTHKGRILRMAPDHPCLTPRGWVPAGELVVGDVLAEIHPTESAGSSTITASEARFMGYLTGDGSCSNEGLGFTNEDPATLADFESTLAPLGMEVGRKYLTNRTWMLGLRAVSRGSPTVREWAQRRGFYRATSYTKRVPAEVMAGNEEIVANFLGAYWACDGTIGTRSNKMRPDGHGLRSDLHASITTVSRGLAEDTQHLMTRLGISTRLRVKVANIKTTRQGDTYTSYQVAISDQDGVARLAARIGPHIHHPKREKLARFQRTEFTTVLNADPVVSVTPIAPGECRCLTVKEDASFTVSDLAVHNSMLTSVMWPAWVWARQPSWKALFSSYAMDLVSRDMTKRRELMRSDWYSRWFRDPLTSPFHIKGWSFADDQDTKTFYKNSQLGEFTGVSVGNGTGKRASSLIIDDPLRADDAFSKLKRDNVIRWKTQTMSTRFNDKATATQVLIMQRLHDDDLTGYLLKNEPGKWQHLCLMSEFEPARKSVTRTTKGAVFFEDWRTEPGALLFPAKFPKKVLDDLRRLELGSYGYAGQHQQSPAPADGGMLKREFFSHRWYLPDAKPIEGLDCHALPMQFDMYAMFSDLAFKAVDSSDYVAIQLWGLKGNKIFLLDMAWERMTFTATVQALIDMRAKWTRPPHVNVSGVYIEEAANGAAVMDVLKGRIPGVVPLLPRGSKVSRIMASAPAWEAGSVILPLYHPQMGDFVTEAVSFPKAAHDDGIDAAAYAIDKLLSGFSRTLLEALGSE